MCLTTKSCPLVFPVSQDNYTILNSPIMAVNVFSVPVFLITFRESIETAIIVAVLLAFLKQTLGNTEQDSKVYKRLVRQVRQVHYYLP